MDAKRIQRGDARNGRFRAFHVWLKRRKRAVPALLLLLLRANVAGFMVPWLVGPAAKAWQQPLP